MNKQKRQGIADAFRACLPHLWDGVHCSDGTTYICWALERSNSSHYRSAQRIIEKRLGDCESLEAWLYEQIGEKRFDAECTDKRLQAHRKAWVLKLIEEFEQ